MIRSLSLCILLLTSAAALAQSATPEQNELQALNFYVSQKDEAAINAELRRLQLKYPGWVPPEDLAQLAITAPSTEIDQIYRHIAAGNFAAARETIDTTRAAFPDWTPPAEMLALIDTAEGQKRFDAALAQNNVNEAVKLAGSVPGLLRCDRINNAWRIAEAQAAAGRKGDAFGTYSAVAGACVKPSDVLATLEKADTVATDAQIVALLDQTKIRLPNMASDLTKLEARLLAGRGLSTTQTPAAKNAPAPKAAATPNQTATQNAPAAPAAPAPAKSAGGGTAQASGGVEAAVKAGNWQRCLELTNGSTATGMLYQRAWCAYNLDRPMEALTAFNMALQGRLDRVQRRDASYGVALAYLKLQMTEDAARIAAQSDYTREQRIDIERQILDQRGVNAYKRKQYRKAIAYFDAIEELTGALRRDLAMLRAYSYQNAGQTHRARQEFTKLNEQLSTRETRRALRDFGD